MVCSVQSRESGTNHAWYHMVCAQLLNTHGHILYDMHTCIWSSLAWLTLSTRLNCTATHLSMSTHAYGPSPTALWFSSNTPNHTNCPKNTSNPLRLTFRLETRAIFFVCGCLINILSMTQASPVQDALCPFISSYLVCQPRCCLFFLPRLTWSEAAQHQSGTCGLAQCVLTLLCTAPTAVLSPSNTWSVVCQVQTCILRCEVLRGLLR